jgi:outer membrane receptor protein involved in Fe transport
MRNSPRAHLYAVLLAAFAQDRARCQETAPPAQEPAPEGQPLIVTARKVEERIEDVPGSVSSIDGQSIERSGARSVREATERVPNLVFTEFS